MDMTVQRPLYNPAGIEVVTHELLHSPLAFDPRGGPTTADHVSRHLSLLVEADLIGVCASTRTDHALGAPASSREKLAGRHPWLVRVTLAFIFEHI